MTPIDFFWLIVAAFAALTIPMWMGLLLAFKDAFSTVWQDFINAVRGK
jgi:hypothetical protein